MININKNKTVELQTNGKYCNSNIEINIDVPNSLIEISTATEMAEVLANISNIGKVYKFTGTTGTYMNGHLYSPQMDYSDMLCFTANTAGSTITLTKVGSPSWTGYYSKDGSTWAEYVPSSTGAITLTNAGDKVYFYGTYTAANNYNKYLKFVMTGSIAASGNIMSFCCGANFEEEVTLSYDYELSSLFLGCTSLTTAPELPAVWLSSNCYEDMFANSGITTAPALPASQLQPNCYCGMFRLSNITTTPILVARTLKARCYYGMFQGCTSLTTASAISATTLASECCEEMFKGCTSLTNAPALSVTKAEYRCYDHMFEFCTALTTPPSLPATELATYCYDHMFYHSGITSAPTLSVTDLTDCTGCYLGMFAYCSSLTTPPTLPATTLAESCYSNMFEGSVITTTPTLSATNLADYCYGAMFKNCTSLTSASTLPATTLTEGCYKEMFYGCNWLSTAPTISATTLAESCCELMFAFSANFYNPPALPAMTLAKNCYLNMFESCIGIESAPALPAITLAEGCYKNMFKDCRYMIEAPKLPATTLAVSCYECMFQDCEDLVIPPALPATILAEDCYDNMFNGCESLEYIPYLPSTGDYSAYDSMFEGCTSLYISDEYESGTAEYQWDIPASGVSADYITANDIFNGCAGTRSSDDLYCEPESSCQYFTQHRPIADWLCFTTSDDNCTVRMNTYGSFSFEHNFSVSTDGGETWEEFEPSTSTITLENTGDKVYFIGDNPDGVCENTGCYSFEFSENVYASGNIMSLIDNGKCTTLAIPNEWCFYDLFYSAEIITPPSLPATTLTECCYQGMFQNCTSLTTVPKLPATALADACYECMFKGCTSLQVNDSSVSGTAEKEWKIPTSGTIESLSEQQDMFADCAGTRSSDNLEGAAGEQYTYYTQNTPV